MVNLGTMRREDLFLTDARLDAIPEFFNQEEYDVSNWEDGEFLEIKRKVDLLNGL